MISAFFLQSTDRQFSGLMLILLFLLVDARLQDEIQALKPVFKVAKMTFFHKLTW